MAFSSKVEQWRSWLEQLRGDLPMLFMLGWLQHESGGNPCSVGIPNVEAGIAQTYHPDDDRFGATFAQLREGCSGSTLTKPLTDEQKARQVRVFVAYVGDRVKRARAAVATHKLPWSESSSDFWALVKLHHALPAFYGFLSPYVRAHGGPPPTFLAYRRYVEALSDAEFVELVPAAARWKSAEQRARLFNNATKVGAYGGPSGKEPSSVALYAAAALAIMAAWLAKYGPKRPAA